MVNVRDGVIFIPFLLVDDETSAVGDARAR
jgi:hypothetical protein